MEPVSINNRGYWTWTPIAPVIPPSMTIPEEEKGEYYHSVWMRYFLSSQVSQWRNYYLSNYADNVGYAIDSRFGEESDVRMFFGDGAAQTTRIPFKFPIMSPMLTRMIGGVDNLSIAATAESATPSYVKARKEDFMLEGMMLSEAAAAGPMMAAAYEGMGVSPDQEETERIREMSYTDHLVRGANSLMAMMAERTGLDKTKRQVAMFMATSGAAAIHTFQNGNKLEDEVIEPREFGWDTSAMKPNLSDGRFMYVSPLMSVSAIAERWNPKADIIYSLDKWARLLPGGNNFQAGWPQSRPRVFTMYWKDMRVIERGYIMKDGELEYCTINEKDPDTGEIAYTDKDLVDPPVNKYTLAWTEAERRAKKQRRSIEILRYCSMIPWEYMPGGYTKGVTYSSSLKAPVPPSNSGLPNVGFVGDMVMDYGVYDLQEVDPDDVFSVKFPIKAATWRYIGGHIVAPLTAARDPQRWMNQITSDIAYRLRTAGGKLTVIASSALAGTQMSEQEIEMKSKEGGVAIIDGTLTGGIANASGVIDSSPSSSFYQMLGMLPQVKEVAESAVGIYEANYGAPQGQDQLVGTLKIQLQQAGTQQQPFYAAIADVYQEVHQFHVQAGKQFYTRRPWMLEQMVGSEDMEAFLASKDMTLEQFRVKVELSPDGAQLRIITDQQTIPGLMQMGMLDPVTAAQLLGRSIPSDVYAAAREYTKKAAEAQQRAAEDQQQAAQAQMLAQEQAAIDQQNIQLGNEETQAGLKMAQINQKASMPYAQAEAAHLKPEANPLLGNT